MTFRCRTHQVLLTIGPTNRTYELPKGSFCGVPHCALLTERTPIPGRIRDCVIERVSDDVPGRTA